MRNVLTVSLGKKWSLLSWLIAIVLFLPIAALIGVATGNGGENFNHLYETVLWDYVLNSIWLLLGVCACAVLWGLPSAWLVVRFRFPASRFFRWALLLPMAMPSYLVAFFYTEMLDYAGPVQMALRAWFGWTNASDYWFVDMRTMGGAIFVLSLVFSPYVFWLASLNFSTQSHSLIQAAQLLGASEWRLFFRVALPVARPALAVACTLVGMETLADYGTAAYFSVWHLTTAIYDVWLQMFDLVTAAKLSTLLLLFVVILVTLEKRSRRHLQTHHTQSQSLLRRDIQGMMRWLAFAWCTLVFLLGFALPALWLLQQAWRYFSDTDWSAFAVMTLHTLSVALAAASLAAILAFLLLAYARSNPQKGMWAVRASSLGYAIPGTVLAIGVLIMTTSADHLFNALTNYWGYGNVGLVFSGTLFALTLAFVCRFAAVACGTLEAGMTKIPESLDASAQMLGASGLSIVWRVWWPLLRGSVLTAFLLVFLESMKELSAALLLRPFNVQLLSTYIYEYMSSEHFEVAALPALLLVIAGLPTVLLLVYMLKEEK